MEHENQLFELTYWFEDFLIGDFERLHLTQDHVCLNQKTTKNLFKDDGIKSMHNQKKQLECIRCYKRNQWVELWAEVLKYIIINFIKENMLHFSYPFWA